MLRSAMLAALATAAAGTMDERRPVGPCSALVDDRSSTTQSSFVHNNLLILVAQQLEQLSQCNVQLLGREHALDCEGCIVLHGVADGSAGDILRDDWKQHFQQLCHRLEEALFNAAALAPSCDARIHLGRVQQIDGSRFWSRRSSDIGSIVRAASHGLHVPIAA